jgi:hypothetical protein
MHTDKTRRHLTPICTHLCSYVANFCRLAWRVGAFSLASLLVAIIWWQSETWCDLAGFVSTTGRCFFLATHPGGLGIGRSANLPGLVGRGIGKPSAPSDFFGRPPPAGWYRTRFVWADRFYTTRGIYDDTNAVPAGMKRPPLIWVHEAWSPPQHGFGGLGWSTAFAGGWPTGQADELDVPFWLLGLGLATVAFFRPRRWLASRRSIGSCRRCGYDLRATPGRCPECGTVAIAERPI